MSYSFNFHLEKADAGCSPPRHRDQKGRVNRNGHLVDESLLRQPDGQTLSNKKKPPACDINLCLIELLPRAISSECIPNIEAMYMGMPSDKLSGWKPKAEMKNM